MNNKAFTLIELMAIIVVLAAIFLVSFPAILNISKSDENKKYDDMVKDLCFAGKSYIYADTYLNTKEFYIGYTKEINIQELITYGSVDNNLINPKTGISVKEDYLVFTVLDDYSLDCQYKES